MSTISLTARINRIGIACPRRHKSTFIIFKRESFITCYIFVCYGANVLRTCWIGTAIWASIATRKLRSYWRQVHHVRIWGARIRPASDNLATNTECKVMFSHSEFMVGKIEIFDWTLWVFIIMLIYETENTCVLLTIWVVYLETHAYLHK